MMSPTIVWSWLVQVASMGSFETSRFQSSAPGNIVHAPTWPGIPGAASVVVAVSEPSLEQPKLPKKRAEKRTRRRERVIVVPRRKVAQLARATPYDTENGLAARRRFPG